MRVATVLDEIREMNEWVRNVESKIRKETQHNAKCIAKQVQIDGGPTSDDKHATASEKESSACKQKELVEAHGWEHLPAGVVEKRCRDYLQRRFPQVTELRTNQVTNYGDAKPRQGLLGQTRASYMGEDNDEDSHLVDKLHGIPKAAMEHADFWVLTDSRQLASRRILSKDKPTVVDTVSTSRTAATTEVRRPSASPIYPARKLPNVLALAVSGFQEFGSQDSLPKVSVKPPYASECSSEGEIQRVPIPASMPEPTPPSVESPNHTAS